MSFRFALLSLLALSILSSSLFAAQWPTTRFVAHQGTPNAGLFDDILPIDPPLTPEVAADLEDYLNSIALELQQDFPAPALQQNTQIEDGPAGPPAYMVYYYDAGDDFGTAVYAFNPDCKNPETGTIRINASGFIDNGRISTKGYVDLAHELFHAIQMSTRVGKENCESRYGHWILEGQAEAFGQDMAMKFRHTASQNPLVRWGGRPTYNTTLYIKPDPGGNLSRQAYQTSSFWRYLAEAWHLRETVKVGSKPGPDLDANYGTNYAYLADLMDQSIPGQGEAAEMEWIDSWLQSNFQAGLYRVYTDFVAVLAQYGRYRFKGSKSPEETETRWRNTVFGGKIESGVPAPACKTISLKPEDAVAVQPVSLESTATQCIELDVGAFDTPKTFNINVVAQDKTGLRQVRLAMAGGQQTQMGTLIKELPGSSGVSATWLLELNNNKKQYLLLTNVAKEAEKTRKQVVTVHFALSKYDPSEKPAPFRSSKAKTVPVATPPPGPAGAQQAREIRHAQMVSSTSGLGSTGWSYTTRPDRCLSPRKWRVECDSVAAISLSVTRPPDMGADVATDFSTGFLDRMLEAVPTADFTEVARFEDYIFDSPGVSIGLGVPGIDYGFTGVVTDAIIEVNGGLGNPDLVSLGPQPLDPQPPCAYGPPVGKVTIEEFTPHVLRGNYSAALVEGGSPRGVRTCPPKSVVKTVSGSFVIASPIMMDERYEEDTSWLEEEMMDQIGGMMPPGMDFTAPPPATAPSTPTPSSGPGSSGGYDDLDEVTADDCACTCDEFRKGMQSAQNLMNSIDGEPESEAMRLMVCMSFCAAELVNCDF